jgi:hypothetical protein
MTPGVCAYGSFSSMEKKSVEGFLDLLDAQIFCFQGTCLIGHSVDKLS